VLDEWKIKCLVPDLPSLDEVAPYIRQMDAARWYSNFGPIVTAFEGKMQAFLAAQSPALGARDAHVVSFSSATTALELMLRGSGLAEGTRILTPALTFSATAASIKITGHVPILTDVDPITWDLTPEIARQVMAETPVDAILPVAIYGYPIDMDAWAAFQEETGVRVFVDAAAALGQQPVHPDIPVCFSLHATKPFGIGEGGLLVTGDADLAERARRLSNFAFVKGTSREVGTNAKLAEVLGAYGLAQLERFDHVYEQRQRVHQTYLQELGQDRFHPKSAEFVPGTLLVDTRGRAADATERLHAAGIQTRQWYFPPLSDHAAFADVAVVAPDGSRALTVIDRLQNSLVGLPFHAFLSDDDIKTVAAELRPAMGN